MEWELSKENVQPLRKGRKVDILNEALQTKDESPTSSKLLESQRRSMIEAIDSYEGDDPLHPWLQCIRWVKDAYPTGGYQSELLPVVEACTRTFQEDERYKSDARYLRVWVLYADLCKEPREIYQFLEVHCIGQDHALFYEAYATYMEVCKNHSKANEIYELGLHRGAQPTTRLQSMYQSFLKRMMQRNERKLQEDQVDSYESEKLRHFGDSRSSQSRASARNPVFLQDQQRRKLQQPQVQRSGMEVFVDDDLHSGTRPLSIPRTASATRAPDGTTWKNLGTQKETKKENDQLPARWTETKVPRIGKVPKHVEAHPPIIVFVDDECEEAQARMKAKDVSVTSATLRQRVDGVCDLRRDQETLQKNPLLHFTEGEKPSTASLLRKEPCGNACDQASDESLSGDGNTISLFGAPHLVGSEFCKVREDGHESSFEEARLLRWKMSHQPPNQNAVPSLRSTAEKAKLIEKSLSMFQSKSVSEKTEKHSPLSHLSDREPSESGRQPGTVHARDADVPSQRMSRGNSHGSSTDKSIASFMPPQSNRSSLSQVSSISSMDELPAFACTMPTSQFSMNGEETVAIKKYAEELITLGADPNGRGIDIGGHQGLIDQTINTKECLQDILSMFNRPLSCEKPQRKARVSNSSRPTPLSNEGFEVFVDDLDDSHVIPGPQKNGMNKNRGFEIFNDEENDPNHLNKMPGKKGFEVFVDEDEEAPPSKSTSLHKKKPFQVFQDEGNVPQKPGKAGFDVFVDERVDVQPGQNRITRPPVRKPSSARGSFDVFVDDDREAQSGASNSGQGLKVFEDHDQFKPSGTTKPTFQVYTDEISDSPPRETNKSASQPEAFAIHTDEVLTAPRNVGRGFLKTNPVREPQNTGFSIFVDEDVASQPVRKPRLPPTAGR